MPDSQHDATPTLRDRLEHIPREDIIDYLMDWADEDPLMRDVLDEFVTDWEIEQIPDDVRHMRPSGELTP